MMERDKLISLVTKAQQGDQDALNDLFNAFYNDVYYFALKTVKDDQIACDITQETFVEIINTLGNLQEPAAFVKWMKQITYHQCTRYFKKKKDVIVDEDEDGNTIFDTLQEDKAEFIPEEALDKDDFKKTIMSMIDDLSEEQRAALMMFYYDELSIKQIAEIQGTNENTVKSRLNYAKKGIKKSVEDYEKKNGVKLHCVGVLPLLLWLFKDYFAQSVPASATVVAEGVAGATGTAVAITATTTTTVATTATTTAAVGIGAKIASLPIATKIIAGIVAATIAIGGVTTAVVLSNGDNNPSVDSSIVSGDDTSSTDDQQNDKSPDEYSFVPDYLKGLTHEQALQQYADWLCSYELPYFNSTDEISVDDAFRFGYGNWQGHNENGVQIMTTSIGYQKDLLKAIFGREFDFTQLTSKYVVEVPPAGTITNSTVIEIVSDVRLPSNASINMYPPVEDNGDGTYSYMFLHTKVVDTLPAGREEGTYDYQPDPENNNAMRYALHDHCVLLTIVQKDGFWVMKSYEERPMSEWYKAIEQPYQDSNPEHTHTWGNWETVTKAFIGKDGTEKRTCSTCSVSETRNTSSGALDNSFWPYYGIDGMFGNGESSPLNEERIQGYTLLECIGYGYEGEERDGMDFEISSAGAFAFLDEHFVLTDAQKASMKEDSRYNAATDKFSLTWPGSNLNREICGYTHNGGNNYTVYYAASNSGGEECNVYWKVVLEHNAPNGKPNRYISIVRVDSIPSNITK